MWKKKVSSRTAISFSGIAKVLNKSIKTLVILTNILVVRDKTYFPMYKSDRN